MQITTSQGAMFLDGNAAPSIDDMNDIIHSLTRDDDNGAEFQALCDASTVFPSDTNEAFYTACTDWLANVPA